MKCINASHGVLLTIAIPTFNRSAYLAELVPLLILQCHEAVQRPGAIELLIVDNASPDGTQQLVQNLISGKEWIRYVRNPENVGADANFIRCFEEANGVYVWLFGDDDLPAPGAVSSVLRRLQSDGAALYVLSDGSFTRSMGGDRKFSGYAAAVAFFSITNPFTLIAHSLITLNVLRRDCFDPEIARGRIHTNYGHMYAMMARLLPVTDIIYFVKETLINVREERAVFAEPLKHLIAKQRDYLLYLAKQCRSVRLRWFAYSWYMRRKMAVARAKFGAFLLRGI